MDSVRVIRQRRLQDPVSQRPRRSLTSLEGDCQVAKKKAAKKATAKVAKKATKKVAKKAVAKKVAKKAVKKTTKKAVKKTAKKAATPSSPAPM